MLRVTRHGVQLVILIKSIAGNLFDLSLNSGYIGVPARVKMPDELLNETLTNFRTLILVEICALE